LKKTYPACIGTGINSVLVAAIWCALSTSANAQPNDDAVTIIQDKCAVACHSNKALGQWGRISSQRKTPEGWLMSIARMQNAHGLKISDEDRRTVVKYLADRQGLAPSEVEPARYALEGRLDTVENIGDQQYVEMCARCHSAARPALQRRPLEEWRYLINQHLGQWPSVEYSSLGRDRDWLAVALLKIAPYLTKTFPYDSDAWKQWKKSRPASPDAFAGDWSFSGHMPGRGNLRGHMQVRSSGNDLYALDVKGEYADGSPFNGSGTALVYTGYEWRGNITIDGVPMHQVFAVLNGHMQGRMFETEHTERGLDFAAVRQDGPSTVLAVQPPYIKLGTETVLTLVGTGLEAQPTFGAGIQVLSVEGKGNVMQVKVRADANAATGMHTVHVGASEATVAVYESLDQVKVVPAYAVARIGGNGGSRPKVEGRFDAEAWGKDNRGKAFRIGILPASWSVVPFDDTAKEEQDVTFAGVMDATHGVFMPGDAGPNPMRKMHANNTGNLKVLADVQDDGRTITGEGQLIVAVPTWVNPPIP